MTTNDGVPGAAVGRSGCTEWELDGDELYRIVYTDEQRVDGCEHGVHLSALQHPDGSLSRDNPTEIYVYIAGDGPCPVHNPVRWLRYARRRRAS